MATDNKNGQMRSDLIKTGPDHAPARAMLRATGLDDAAIARPLVGIVHSWSNVSPCNLNLRDLAAAAADGVRAAGGTPFEFNTIAVTDGIAMGSPGMRSSLVSREIIADSIELAVEGHCLDAVLVLCHAYGRSNDATYFMRSTNDRERGELVGRLPNPPVGGLDPSRRHE